MSTSENATPPGQEPGRSDLHEAAIAYAESGWAVFPTDAQKRPLCTNGHKDATTDAAVIDAWWQTWPDANVATVPGRQGFCVVDLDPPNGQANWAALQDRHGVAPRTWTVRSPRGGLHLYFVGHLRPSTSKLAPHVDTRGDDSYVLLPPSATTDGVYTVEDDSDVALVPDWIAPALAARKRTVVEAPPDVQLDLPFNISRANTYLAGKAPLVEGHGSDEGAFVLACELRELGISRDTALDMLHNWQPEFDDEWWEEKVTNGYQYASNGAGAFASQPTIEAFGAYAAKHGLVAGGPDPGRTATTTVGTLAGGGLVKITTRYGTFAEAMDLLRDLTEAGKAKPKATYRFQLRDEATQDAAPDIVPLVEGFLSDGGTACIHGPLGSYKSFVATEIAFAVATGKPCFGKLKVHRSGPVIYLLGEGSAGIEKRRRRTLRHAYGITGPIPFYTCKAVPLTRDGHEAVQACVDDIRAQLGHGVRPALVLLDTKTVAMAGLNEDKAGDAQMYVEGATFIAEQLGCLMLTVAHEGLTAGRMRGSTAAPQGIEDVWTIENNADRRTACLKPVRLKDDELDPIYLQGRAVNVPGLPKSGLVFDMVSEDEYKRAGGKDGPKNEGSALTREVGVALVHLGGTDPEHAVRLPKLAEYLTQITQPHLIVGSREFRTTLGQQKRRLRDAISKSRYPKGNGPLALFHHDMAPWGGSSTDLEPHFYLPVQVGDYGAEDD